MTLADPHHGSALSLAWEASRSPAVMAALRSAPLPPDISAVVQAAAGSGSLLERAAEALGVPASQLLTGLRTYLREVAMHADADAARMLALPPRADLETIRSHHRWLMHWLHPDRAGAAPDPAIASRLNQAWQQLRPLWDESRASSHASPSASAAAAGRGPIWAAEEVADRQRMPAWAIPVGLMALCIGLLWMALDQPTPLQGKDAEAATDDDRPEQLALQVPPALHRLSRQTPAPGARPAAEVVADARSTAQPTPVPAASVPQVLAKTVPVQTLPTPSQPAPKPALAPPKPPPAPARVAIHGKAEPGAQPVAAADRQDASVTGPSVQPVAAKALPRSAAASVAQATPASDAPSSLAASSTHEDESVLDTRAGLSVARQLHYYFSNPRSPMPSLLVDAALQAQAMRVRRALHAGTAGRVAFADTVVERRPDGAMETLSRYQVESADGSLASKGRLRLILDVEGSRWLVTRIELES